MTITRVILDRDLLLERQDLINISNSKNIRENFLLIEEGANRHNHNLEIESFFFNKILKKISFFFIYYIFYIK